MDLWIGYGRPLKNKRFEWRSQLNLRNAFQKHEVIPITAQPDGSPAGYRIVQGMTWTWSNSLKF